MSKTRETCGHNILVTCFESAENVFCRTAVKRLLKCDHEAMVACSQIMNDFLCREIVDRLLVCGHETKLLCHSDPNKYQCKIEVKKQLPCSHYRNMKCFEQPLATMCKTYVDKELPCGHTKTVECRLDAKHIVCPIKVTATLECGHSVTKRPSLLRRKPSIINFRSQVDVSCFLKTKGKIECRELCEERLDCGHSCPLKCHYFKDRHHEKFQCKKLCAKSCPEGKKPDPCAFRFLNVSSCLQVTHARPTTPVIYNVKNVSQSWNVPLPNVVIPPKFAASNRWLQSSARLNAPKFYPADIHVATTASILVDHARYPHF